jgi:hypothetical protein
MGLVCYECLPNNSGQMCVVVELKIKNFPQELLQKRKMKTCYLISEG